MKPTRENGSTTGRAAWTFAALLRGLGLERYEPAFRYNGLDAEILPRLTVEDLKDIGVTRVGDRRKLLEVIAALHEGAPPLSAAEQPSEVPGPAAQPPFGAERRHLAVMSLGGLRCHPLLSVNQL